MAGYNDVRVPNAAGTDVSLTDELETDPAPFFRVRMLYSPRERHTFLVLFAPLRLEADGRIGRPLHFEGETFAEGVRLRSKYRFDSYRITYRYELRRNGAFHCGFGLTAKVRDASIRFEGEGKASEKKNTGFVPLINFRLQWMVTGGMSLVLDGDALAAPQGRAEDVLLALQYEPRESVALRLGYRVLEGGADVEEVYNFTLLHYISVGATYSF